MIFFVKSCISIKDYKKANEFIAACKHIKKLTKQQQEFLFKLEYILKRAKAKVQMLLKEGYNKGEICNIVTEARETEIIGWIRELSQKQREKQGSERAPEL